MRSNVTPPGPGSCESQIDPHHFSLKGLISISCVMAERCCVCSCQYVSAIWASHPVSLVYFSLKSNLIDIGATHSISVDFRIRACIFEIVCTARDVDNAIDDHMANMDTLRCEFSSQRLGQSPLSKFRRSECREASRAFECCGCACKNQSGVVLGVVGC